jgi:hypothetical protein
VLLKTAGWVRLVKIAHRPLSPHHPFPPSPLAPKAMASLRSILIRESPCFIRGSSIVVVQWVRFVIFGIGVRDLSLFDHILPVPVGFVSQFSKR